MPRNLKLYITGVVTLSAVALVVATRSLFPRSRHRPHIRHRNIPGVTVAVERQPTQLQIFAGILFWTVLTLVGVRTARSSFREVHSSALPWRQSWRRCRSAVPPSEVGSRRSDTTEMREIRGRIPWYGSLANHAGAIPAAIAGGVVQVSVISDFGEPPSATIRRRASSRRWLLRRRVLRAQCQQSLGTLLALRTGPSNSRQLS